MSEQPSDVDLNEVDETAIAYDEAENTTPEPDPDTEGDYDDPDDDALIPDDDEEGSEQFNVEEEGEG